MHIELNREITPGRTTHGFLYVDGQYRCHTLEDPVREVYVEGDWRWNSGMKINGQTAIPHGVYELVINQSARFKRRLPLLLNVPDFVGVRIHPGNTAADTEGCILLGNRREGDAVRDSRAAFDAFFPELDRALMLGKVYIEIQNRRA